MPNFIRTLAFINEFESINFVQLTILKNTGFLEKIISIIVSISFLVSCSNNSAPKGHWHLDFGVKQENPFFPIELNFNKDSLILNNSFCFQQTCSYVINNQNIELSFTNGTQQNYPFKVDNDSTLFFANHKFIRAYHQNPLSFEPYEIIGYSSEPIVKFKENSISFHLIKQNDSTRVILDEDVYSLPKLNEYLDKIENGNFTVYIFIGQGIVLEDLIKSYVILEKYGYNEIELITDYVCFDKFYSVHVDLIQNKPMDSIQNMKIEEYFKLISKAE